MTSLGKRIADHLRDADLAVTVAWVAIAAGAFIRILHFVDRRSLWTDEAALATNIVQRGFGGLLQPLDGNQGAPVVFLWLERIMVLVGGNNEYALRFLPLVAGVALLPLVYLLGRRIGSPAVGAGATVLVAFSPSLVRYATEVKQYSTDALLAVGLILLAIRLVDGDHTRRDLMAIAAVGSVAIWSSHPAIFVLAGVGAVLAAGVVRTRDWGGLLPVVGVGATWAVSAAALYVVSLRKLEGNEFLTTYWQDGFVPRPVSVGGALRWIGDASVSITSDPLGLAFPVVGIAACLVGLVMLARSKPWRTAMLVAPLPFLLVAATVERYPFQGRLVLFLVPLLLLGLCGLLLDHRWRLLALPVIAVLAASSVVDVARTVADPPEIADSRPVFEHMADNWRVGDQAWVHDVTIEPYQYYGPVTGIDADRRTRWSTGASCDLDAAGRVWVVFAYTLSSRPDDEASRLRTHLAHYGEILDVVERTDASATLFDFDGATGPAPPDPELGCISTSPEPPVPRSGLATGPFGSGQES